MIRAYTEIVDFIASGTTPSSVAEFSASSETKSRVEYLLRQEKTQELTPEEQSELNHFLEIEHLMRLAKARARSIASE